MRIITSLWVQKTVLLMFLQSQELRLFHLGLFCILMQAQLRTQFVLPLLSLDLFLDNLSTVSLLSLCQPLLVLSIFSRSSWLVNVLKTQEHLHHHLFHFHHSHQRSLQPTAQLPFLLSAQSATWAVTQSATQPPLRFHQNQTTTSAGSSIFTSTITSVISSVSCSSVSCSVPSMVTCSMVSRSVTYSGCSSKISSAISSVFTCFSRTGSYRKTIRKGLFF